MNSSLVVNFMHNVSRVIINPLIVLAFAVAVIVFVYGVFEFVWKSDNDGARDIGKRHMLYGIIGLAIMVSVFGIIKFIANTVGTDMNSLQSVISL